MLTADAGPAAGGTLGSMFRYADPHACPGCRTSMEPGAPRCLSCDLALKGHLAQRLFTTLSHADDLLAQLYVASAPAPQPVAVGAPAATGHAEHRTTAPAQLPLPTPYTRPVPHRGGLSAASVPKILLGLGATCLLVAALVFLAVAWAALGVGGRTGVLVLLTVAAGGLAAWLAGRGLRAGAESFTSVALGLLLLDVVGADRAGWLGGPGTPALLLICGVAVGVPGALGALAGRRTPVRSLVSGEAFAGLGLVLVGAGLLVHEELGLDAGIVSALVVTATATYAAWRANLPITAGCGAAATAVWWSGMVALGLTRIDDLTFAALWGALDLRLLLVAALAPAVVAVVPGLPRGVRAAAASVAVAVATFDLTLVAFDESATTRALVELAVVTVAAAASVLLAPPWRWVTVAPASVAGALLGAGALLLAGTSLEALLDLDPWRESLSAPTQVPDLAWSWPLLLPAGAVGALVAAWLLGRCVAQVPLRAGVWWVAPVLLVTAALVPTLYAVPLLAALLVLGLGAAAGAGLAAYARRPEPLVATAALALLLLVAAFADEWSTLVVLGVLAAACLIPALRRTDDVVAVLGSAGLAWTGAGFLWTAATLAGVDPSWRALPVLALVAALTLLRPGVERELPAYLVAAVAAAASVVHDGEVAWTWLAVYLTVGGVVLTSSALVHPARRVLSWGGLVLFTLAQWVRLQQLGVETVEAYTLPLGLVLLAVGLVRMRDGGLPSIRALGAGLGLALVPTFLQVLADPVSTRALLLGLACLLLVAAGVALRWSAPLLAGAAIGGLVVLREAAHASVLPQWMVIGLVGIALTVVGVTWERRLAELRAAAGYVRALR